MAQGEACIYVVLTYSPRGAKGSSLQKAHGRSMGITEASNQLISRVFHYPPYSIIPLTTAISVCWSRLPNVYFPRVPLLSVCLESRIIIDLE